MVQQEENNNRYKIIVSMEANTIPNTHVHIHMYKM